MSRTDLIDNRVILLKKYLCYKKGTEFRCDGFQYAPYLLDGRVFDINFIEKRKDLFKDKND